MKVFMAKSIKPLLIQYSFIPQTVCLGIQL